MSLKPFVYPLHRHGSALAGRDLGREIADDLRRDVPATHLLIVDFSEVQLASSPVLDEIVIALRAMIADQPDRHILLCGINEDLLDTLELVVERRDIILTRREDDGDLRTVGGSRTLQETLDEAQHLGVFTAPQLAERLELKLPNLHQRLTQLQAAGALTRAEDTTAQRGRRLIFSTPGADSPSD